MISLGMCNPFVRIAMIQETITEGERPRRPYDNRLFLICKGTGAIILNGKKIEVGENTLIYLGTEDNYFFCGKLCAAIINFDMTMAYSDYKSPVSPELCEMYDTSKVFDKTDAMGFLSPIIFCVDEKLKKSILLLVESYIKGGNYSEALCSALLKEILVDILRAKDQTTTNRTLLAQKVLLYIRDNAPTITSNLEIAKAFGYHPVYLGELFKSQIGMTLHAAVNREKLYLAARLLMYTSNSVEEVAYTSGFSSRNQLCTVFKKYFGETPLSYRNKSRLSFV